jgi:hypothetical protein
MKSYRTAKISGKYQDLVNGNRKRYGFYSAELNLILGILSHVWLFLLEFASCPNWFYTVYCIDIGYIVLMFVTFSGNMRALCQHVNLLLLLNLAKAHFYKLVSNHVPCAL